MPFDILSPSEQVAQHLKKLILRGRWDRNLPGTPALSKETGIDRKTITAAIQLLEEQGVVQSQGAGRPRKIVLSEKQRRRGLKITLLLYDEGVKDKLYIQKLQSLLTAAGHTLEFSRRSLTSMGMDLEKVKRFVRANPSDVWIPTAASKEILEWFATQPFATIALFGRRREVPIAGAGPDKIGAIRELTQKLISLGHERIVMFSREERLHPSLGLFERVYLETLQANGIKAGSYNLPDWKSNARGFQECLDGLFKVTPPTALIIEESQFFVAALLELSRRGISIPEQISICCTDNDIVFEMCAPHVTCINWPSDPVVQHIVKWVRKVSRGKVNNKQVYTPASILEGGTIGPVPGARAQTGET
ncbi:hypothetical protein DDZ13_12655 [Coraliomargarita sinensis]|uniref:HTH gntR-type domain-containing protein n=1 Tax=Coraliomargarita sinensis TaxID=2174842 RepID=A0A317ZDT7_9BACT|nr:substrate-binding domain-containing protein [Coraliomargarita sinensis]PXA03270.1 hypothetical protein DDZ13_12655 [Coraliomargarita sinensis]